MKRLFLLALACGWLAGCGGSDGGVFVVAGFNPETETEAETENENEVGPSNTDPTITRIALAEPLAWDFQSRHRDNFASHRPSEIDCDRGEGWFIEDGAIEIRTDSCNYLSLVQESLLNIPAGTRLDCRISHGELIYRSEAQAHLALSIAGNVVYEEYIDIPGEAAIRCGEIVLDFDVEQRDPIELNLYNHGSNAWTIHGLDVLFEGDFDPEAFCPSFDNTFDAIQATLFEQAGCASSQCHSAEAAAGGLDLTAEVAYDNLVDSPSESSDHLLVKPRAPSRSYLYQKLSAKTRPGSFDIAGSPMPAASEPISAGQLEALRLWIEAGAPRQGSVGDTLGRGEDELERLLGVCLPEPEAVNVEPLDPPAPEEGVQFRMPAHAVAAESERELCFAVYEDFRDQIPRQYMNADRSLFYVRGEEVREDPFTHHNVLFYSGVSVDEIYDPTYGEWTCAGGDLAGQACEPTDRNSCGDNGTCRSEIRDSIACQGFGPGTGRVQQADNGVRLFSVDGGPVTDGFYEEVPTHGIFYWNSHAFNLTTEDGMHNVWRNLYFADDRRYRSQRVTDGRHIFAGAGTEPFSRQEVCREHVMEHGDALLSVSSHTHKRGELFTVALKGEEAEPFYVNKNYDEPLLLNFDPPWEFNQQDEVSRTLVYCATYNNGLNPDDSLNLDTVTRLSRKPERSLCIPSACTAGRVGAPCDGADDHASCDSSDGSGDGFCDACPISAGVTSDDEMFVLLLSKASNFAEQSAHRMPGVTIAEPASEARFSPGETFPLRLDLRHFTLLPPEDHGGDHAGDGHMDGTQGGGHGGSSDDHSRVDGGHFHVYLDTEDDDAPHVTAWETTIDYTLPEDIARGEHILRVNLRAPDHHGLGIEDRIVLIVE